MEHELDFKQMVLDTIAGLESEISFVYSGVGNAMIDSRAHPSLQSIRGRLRVLKTVTENITVKPTVK